MLYLGFYDSDKETDQEAWWISAESLEWMYELLKEIHIYQYGKELDYDPTSNTLGKEKRTKAKKT